jgi:hypothetical protein
MKRIQIFNYKKRKILFVNLADLNYDEIADTLKKTSNIISKEPEKSILLLTDVSNINFKNRRTLACINEFLLNHQSYLKAGAIVGLTGIYKTMLKSFKNKININFSIFNTVDEAKEWLIK